MVEAVDVRTTGLGGDSQVSIDRDGRMMVGPRKAMPLCLLAHQAPAALIELRKLVTLQHLPDHATLFALRNPGREAPAHLSAIERRVWNELSHEPRRVSQLLSNAPGLAALRRLADAGLATIGAFTPTDALHVLGRQQGWSAEAAELGARLLAIEERNIHGTSEAADARSVLRTHRRTRDSRIDPDGGGNRTCPRSGCGVTGGFVGPVGGPPHRRARGRPSIRKAGARRNLARDAPGGDRRARGRVLPGGRPPIERELVHPATRRGLQRRGRGGRGGIPEQ